MSPTLTLIYGHPVFSPPFFLPCTVFPSFFFLFTPYPLSPLLFLASQHLLICYPPLSVRLCVPILHAAPGSDIWCSPLCYCHPLTQLSVELQAHSTTRKPVLLFLTMGTKQGSERCQVSQNGRNGNLIHCILNINSDKKMCKVFDEGLT